MSDTARVAARDGPAAPSDTGLCFDVLGPLRLRCGPRVVPPGARKQRIALTLLLSRANTPVSSDLLATAMWGDHPPASAPDTLRWHVHQIRRTLGDRERIARAGDGYQLTVRPGELDTERFEQLVAQGRLALAAGDASRASDLLHRALGLWRGTPFQDLAERLPVGPESARLTELRLTAAELRAEADSSLGRHAEVVAELSAMVAEHPLGERLHGHLMLALVRSGRSAQALEVFAQIRRLLADQLGTDPGPELRALHERILRDDPDPGPPDWPAVPGDGECAVPPAELPADVANFTGRAAAINALAEMTESGEQATATCVAAITGTAGVGKTALAVHFGHRYASRFPDGQLYVNLRGYDRDEPMRPIEALAYLLAALGMPPERIPADEPGAAGRYRSMLAGKRMLIVLDNARHADQVRPLLPGGPGCAALVTSRDLLTGLAARDGAGLLCLDVLDAEESVALVGGIVGPHRVAAEPDATRDLARLCGHLPLALRVVAAGLAHGPHCSIADRAADLRASRLDTLEVAADSGAAVRIAFDHSYRILAPEVARLFRLLGVAPGPHVTRGSAAALASVTPDDAARLLGVLVAGHLVDHRIPGRYAMHDLLRDFARERGLREDPERERAAATQRLFDYYQRSAYAATGLLYPEAPRLPVPPGPELEFGDPAGALAWLESERTNLVAAATAAGRHPAGYLLSDALCPYFHSRRYVVDWLATAHAGVAAARALGEPSGELSALIGLGRATCLAGRYGEALGHLQRALALSKATGRQADRADVHGHLANAYLDLGRMREAAEHFGQALDLHHDAGHPTRRAVHLGNLGLVHRYLGRLELAARNSRQALALFRAGDSRSGESASHNNLGETLRYLGRTDKALRHLRQGLSLSQRIGRPEGQVFGHAGLAALHRDAGRYRRALHHARSALACARRTEDRYADAHAAVVLADVELRIGNLRDALLLHERALRIARDAGHRHIEAAALLGLATVHSRQTRFGAAREHAARALHLSREHGYRILEGEALTAMAELHLREDQPDRAEESARQAAAVHNDTGYLLARARALVILGDAVHARRENSAAHRHWHAAFTIFSELDAPEAGDLRQRLGAVPVEPACAGIGHDMVVGSCGG